MTAGESTFMVDRHSRHMKWLQGNCTDLLSDDQHTRHAGASPRAALAAPMPSSASRKALKLGKCKSLNGLPGSLVQTK
jgi:hypothetical protein